MDNKQKILNEAKRIEEDSLYSSKGHFSACETWTKINLILGSISVLLSSIAGASALSQFDNHNILAGFLSIIVAALTGITTFVNPNEKAIQHHLAGNKYNSLRNDSRIFYDIEIGDKGSEKLLSELKILNKRRSKLNEESPIIPRWAFITARKGIEQGESNYKIDNI